MNNDNVELVSCEQAEAEHQKTLSALENLLEVTTVSRLKELVEADYDGRCVILPCKVGGMVRDKNDATLPPKQVDCFNVYADGRITYSFHEVGVKQTYIDRWSEQEPDKFVID